MKGNQKFRSIAAQLAVLFIGLLLFVMVAMLAVNNAYMAQFYELRLRHTLTDAYHQVDAHISDESGVDEEFFEEDLPALERSGNITLVVLDRDFNMAFDYADRDEEIMAARLYAYSFRIDEGDARIISRTGDYTIQRKMDEKFNTEYLEMWGLLPSSGWHFMMRIPMESIKASARISNEFILYTILITIVIGILMVGWLSRRIARPIRELTKLSERMANLDFDARYTSGGSNEIGQLGEHFNRMSETLERTISELKTANNELQRNLEEKTRADDMRREFLSNVSHELKTPLALIQGYAEGLEDSIADDPESRDYYLSVIVDEAEKMNTLVQKLLTLNQLEFGADRVEMVRFDLGELIAGKVASAKILADQKQAALLYEGPKSLEVWGDEFKVEEVLTNYLSNAINHVDDLESAEGGSEAKTPETGERRILVRAGRKEDDREKVRISVWNSGSHIPEEDLDQVWDKFFKVDKARTRAYGGSGVGLSIVRAIMESFHQDFGVRNTEDGVEFWFELDFAGSSLEGGEKTEDPAKGAAAQRRRRREQEAAMREELKRQRHLKPEDEVVDAHWVVADPALREETQQKGENGQE